MELILSVKNGEYVLEKIEGNKRNSTNNQQKIYSIIRSIKVSPIRATFYNNSVKLFFGDGRYITLKGYKNNKDLDLFSSILNLVDDNTRVNINNINTKLFKRLAFTGAAIISFSLVGFTSNSKNNNAEAKSDIAITQTIESIPTPIPTPTIVPTVTPTITPTILPTPSLIERVENKDFNDRYTESMLLNISNNTNFAGIPLATGFNEYYCKKALECFNSDIWTFSNKHGNDFGVDPYLPYALFYGESNFEHEKTLPGGSSYNGSAVGIGQHENPNGTNSVTAFNYNTNQYETEIITMENACDLEKNIKMTVMILQNKLKKYNNNIYVAIQSYNYGDWAMNVILEQYAQENNMSVEDVLNNHEDIGWLKYVEHFHNNPQQYLPNWKYKTYGDPNYVKKIMGYYIGTESINILPDGTKVAINLVSLDKTYEEKMR